MDLQERQKVFEKLRMFLSQFTLKGIEKKAEIPCNDPYFEKLQHLIEQITYHNAWFTKENVLYALEVWAKTLSKINIERWVKNYNFSKTTSKTIGVVTAGNIPLVGLHDFLTVLMAGHCIMVKLSSNDRLLLPLLAEYLICIEPRLKNRIVFTEKPLSNFDAIIATGSNNTGRYFEYYFAKYPHIIRKNRNAVAVLTGKETDMELEKLGSDIFRYFGLGCRSVSKLYVPENYNFNSFFRAIYKEKDIIFHHKYKNNYDYNKALNLMNEIPLLENGFLILKEDKGYASPIATLFYEYYDSIETLQKKLKKDNEQIQCIVGDETVPNSIPFGESQQPQLWDYADGVDTMAFLLGGEPT